MTGQTDSENRKNGPKLKGQDTHTHTMYILLSWNIIKKVDSYMDNENI